MEEFEKQLEVKRKLSLPKTKLKDSSWKLKKEERLRKPRTRLHGSQQRPQFLKRHKVKIMTLKLCLIDCLILQMNFLEFEHSNVVQGHIPIILNLFLVLIPMKQKRIMKRYCQPTSLQKFSNPQHHCNNQNQLSHSKSLRVQGLTNLKKHCHLITHGLENYKHIHQL